MISSQPEWLTSQYCCSSSSTTRISRLRGLVVPSGLGGTGTRSALLPHSVSPLLSLHYWQTPRRGFKLPRANSLAIGSPRRRCFSSFLTRREHLHSSVGICCSEGDWADVESGTVVTVVTVQSPTLPIKNFKYIHIRHIQGIYHIYWSIQWAVTYWVHVWSKPEDISQQFFVC